MPEHVFSVIRRTRRTLLGAVAGTVSALALAACGQAAPRGAGGALTLHFQGSGPLDINPALLAAFEAGHRGVRVAATLPPAPGQRDSLLVSAFVAGSGPDVFWSDAPWQFARGPWLLDLLPLARRDRYDLGAFPAGQLLACTRPGGLYGLPRTCSPAAYAARLDVFAAAGARVPEGAYTAAELAGLWAAMTVPGKRVGGELDWSPASTYYLRGFGGHLVDPADDLRCALDGPGAVACGEWMWNRFWKDGSARGSEGQNGWAAFGAGTLAMAVVSAASLPGVSLLYAGFPWTLVPFPRWPAGPATSTTSEFYGIHAGTPHVEAAWALLQFVTSTAWEQAALNAALVPPARSALWPAYAAAVGQRIPGLRGQPLTALSEAVMGGWTYPAETFRYQQAALPVLNRFWQKIFGSVKGLAVARGFAAAAEAVTAAEARAAKSGGAPAGV